MTPTDQGDKQADSEGRLGFPGGNRGWKSNRRRGTRAGRWAAVLGAAPMTLMGTALSGTGPAAAAPATPPTLYAYVGGRANAPVLCARTAAITSRCTLSQALTLARPGSQVDLATPGQAGAYVGNWKVVTGGTSSSRPITIGPAPSVKSPILGGNRGQRRGCETSYCNGPVLTVGHDVYLELDGITVRNSDNTRAGLGGAIENVNGGHLTVSHSAFYDDYANADGGAIDNADDLGSGTAVVNASVFAGNFAANGDGGAIANADIGGSGSVTVSGSRFSGNSAINGEGGAIDNGDTRGDGTLVITGSNFVGNVAGRAGAVDNADNGRGSLTVTGSTFSGNVSALDNGGAIDNADWGGNGSLSVSRSTFAGNDTVGDGGAIDNADSEPTSRGTVTVSSSTFSGNTADVYGGAIDNSDIGVGTLRMWASTLSGNAANNIYGSNGTRGGGSVNNSRRGTVWVAADIFDAPCRMAGGLWNDVGYNIGDNRTCLDKGVGDAEGGAGKLTKLGDFGGPTKTELPTSGNPSIMAIPYRTIVTLGHRSLELCPTADQRGARSRPR